MPITITNKEIEHIFELMDVNGDGKVSRGELIDAFLSLKTPNR